MIITNSSTYQLHSTHYKGIAHSYSIHNSPYIRAQHFISHNEELPYQYQHEIKINIKSYHAIIFSRNIKNAQFDSHERKYTHYV